MSNLLNGEGCERAPTCDLFYQWHQENLDEIERLHITIKRVEDCISHDEDKTGLVFIAAVRRALDGD